MTVMEWATSITAPELLCLVLWVAMTPVAVVKLSQLVFGWPK